MATRHKKSQLMSFDFATSIFVFILIFLIFAGIVIVSMAMGNKQAFDFEAEYIFDNIENNLRYDIPGAISLPATGLIPQS